MDSELVANEKLFAELFDLVKNGKIDEIKSIVENTSPSDLVDHSAGVTLLHLAATYNNPQLIDFLLSSGCDIESKTNSGVTPLLMSAMHGNYDAVKFLLDADANVFTIAKNDLNALRVLLKNMKHVPPEVFASLSERLRRRSVEAVEFDQCKIESALLNNDSVLMREILERDKLEKEMDYDGFLELAIEFGHVEMVGVLVQYGCGSEERKKILMKRLSIVMTSLNTDLECVKPIVGKLVEWGVINHAAIEPLKTIFKEGNQEALQILIDFMIDLHVRVRFECDFFTQMFRNEKVDVIDLLKNRLDVDEQDVDGFSLLHLAVIFKPVSFVERLLDLGADPNVVNSDGKTALFYAKDCECMELLLRRGADVQVVDRFGNSMVKKTMDDQSLLDIVIAHLTEHRMIKMRIWNEIVNDEGVKTLVESCLTQIYCLKHIMINKNTLYSLMKAKDEELMNFRIRDRTVVTRILEIVGKHQFNTYLVRMLEKKLTRAFEFHEMRFEIAKTLAEVMGICDPSHLVVEIVVGFLSARDVLACVRFSK